MTIEIERDRFDRPLIVPPDGGGPVPYQRVSSYGDVLDDTFNLRKWGERHVALGLVDRPDLLNQVAANRTEELSSTDEKKRKSAINKLCDEAKEAAGVSKSANTGTALHKITERIDRGEDVPVMPDPYQGDVVAFTNATMMLEPVSVERFLVCDELKAAGTTDRLYRIGDTDVLTIGDTKTGKSLAFGATKIAVQLAIYSRSVGYDPATGERTILNIDQDRGMIVHLPAGTGTCELLWIDIRRGWDLALLSRDVRESRKVGKKDLISPVQLEELI